MSKGLKARIKNIIPELHFLLSFLYERIIFQFEPDRDMILSIPKNQMISDNGERIVGYIISKMFAAIMIFFLWRLIFFVVGNWKKRPNLRFFVGLFLVCLMGILLMWPTPFCISEDNFITYSYGIRFWPEYWHSAYTSCIYAAMLMVVPSPVFLSVFQWLFAVFVLGYLYNRIQDSPILRGKGKYSVFLVFLMPGVFTLCTNPYRTELYALLCMFLVSATAMDVVDRKKRDGMWLAGNILLCGFVGVWRTEGVILGVLIFVVQLIFVYRYKPIKSIACFACMLAVLIAFMIPQKLGDMKYYGKDYSFINSFPVLKNILSSPDAALSYEGAEEDLEALEAVVPVEILRYYGMDGYRRYNYAQGRPDINQSLAGEETAEAYVNAYYRLVFHNLPIYAKTQMGMLMKALMLIPKEYVVNCDIPPVNDLPPWELEAWKIGRQDYENTPEYTLWNSSDLHKGFTEAALKVRDSIGGFLEKVHFYSIFLILIPLFEIAMFFRELIGFLGNTWSRRKAGSEEKGDSVRTDLKKYLTEKNTLGLAGIAFILLGQAAAIVLVMPAGVLVYFHAYYYCSLLLCLIYLSCLRVGYQRRTAKQATP